MLKSTLKQGLSLNRSVGFALLFYAASWLLQAYPESFQSATFLSTSLLRAGGALLLSLIFLSLNELSFRRLSVKHQFEDEYSEKSVTLFQQLTISNLILTMVAISLMYALTRELGVLLLGVIPVLEAELFRLKMTSRVFAGTLLLLCVATYLPGYFQSFHVSPMPVYSFQSGRQLLFIILPVILLLLQFSTMVSKLFYHHNHKINILQSQALTDPLTQLANRRQFNQLLEIEFARSKRYGSPLVLALFDIDDFKKINDSYGHPVGDRVLKALGKLVFANTRESDIPARYGGEEFAIILPETKENDAVDLLERLRALVARSVFCQPDISVALTISIGLCAIKPEHQNSFELIKHADTLLYDAKRRGKNQVLAPSKEVGAC